MVICQEIQITPVNARVVRMTGDLTNCITLEDGGEIKTLTCTLPECDYTINVGDTIQVDRKYPHKVNLIKAGRINGEIVCYDLMVAPLTDSSIFVAPMLGSKRELFFWDSLFVNAFIGTTEDEDCIAMLYRWSGKPMFLKFESALCAFGNFRRKYDPDPHHVIFVFDVPSKYRDSYDAYVIGKYSLMQEDYKLRILSYHDFDIDGNTGQILLKSKRLRAKMENDLQVKLSNNAELHSKPNLEREILDFSQYAPAKKIL